MLTCTPPMSTRPRPSTLSAERDYWRSWPNTDAPPKFSTIVQQLHDGMLVRVQDNGETSAPFYVSNGVKQGCVLAPTEFSLIFSSIPSEVFRNSDVGIGINTKKTEVMHQPAPGKHYVEPNVSVNGQRLAAVDKVTYLGSTLSRNVVIDDEVNARLAKASAAFARLQQNVWYRRCITQETKIKVYKAVVLTTLLYGCETWTVFKRHATKLNHFHTTSLRRLLGIVWQDKIPDTEVLARANLPSIHTILMQAQLCWAGHVVCMPGHRLLRKLLYGELLQGKRSHGGAKKHYKDTLKASLKAFDFNPDTWEDSACDRNKWRLAVHKGTAAHEAKRTPAAEERRQARNTRASNAPSAADIPCPHCQRLFRARIGLTSHLRTHARRSRRPPDDQIVFVDPRRTNNNNILCNGAPCPLIHYTNYR